MSDEHEQRQIGVLREQAAVQRRLGNFKGAIDLLQRALSLDPDHAVAHAQLAFTLLGAQRLAGAVIEAKLAMALDADSTYVHAVMARVLYAERKLADAWAHCMIALEAHDADDYVLAARIQRLQGDRARARELLDEALGHAPAHTDALTVLASLELADGNFADAARLAEQALTSDPASRDAHTIAGHIALAQGDAATAEQHARFVLGQVAMDRDGLELWTAIQARRSWTLGLWWRLSSLIAMRDDQQRIAILIGSFVIMRVLIIVTDELGFAGLASMLSWGWFALCAYTWVAPALFRRMLQRSLGQVKLNPEF